MMRRKWLIAGCMGIIGILAVTFVLFQGHREKTVIETVIVNDVPTPPLMENPKRTGLSPIIHSNLVQPKPAYQTLHHRKYGAAIL